jgi:hypothetical protein
MASSRAGIRLTGVAVTTSAPNTASRISRVTATYGVTAADRPPPTPRPSHPPARSSRAASVGWFLPRCSSPAPATPSAVQPTRPRPRGASSAGSRISSTPPRKNSSGSAIAIAPTPRRM